MKRPFLSFLPWTWLNVTLSLILISCSALQPTATSTPLPDIFKTPWEDLSLFKNGLVQSQQSVLSELTNASVYHLEFNIAEDLYHVTGQEAVKYTNAETVPLNEMQLRLFPNILGGEMTVTNVKVDRKSVTPKYGLENSLLIVPFAKPLEPNQSIILSMDFAVTVPQSVELNYGVLAYFDHVLALAHAYPMICVYDDEGWNAEIPPQSGDVTYTDESFYLVRVAAPKNLTLVTTGQTINSSEAGQEQTLNIANGPARDFYLVASPDYTEVSQTFGEVTIHSYASGKVKKGAQMALDVASRAIKDYGARYAPFPYTEFDIVSTPTLALGIEYPGMIAVASRIYDVDSGRWSSVEYKKIPIGLPVAKYTGQEYGAIVYGRGPLFFVALRDEMGTEAFDSFMKDYTQTLSWKISMPETLQSLAEKHCACDLQKIFEEWVYP